MIIFADLENSFQKIQHLFDSKKGKDSYFLNIMFEYHKNLVLKIKAKIMINVELVE